MPELTLKGKAQPVSAWRLISVAPGCTGLRASDRNPVRRPPKRARSARTAFERAARRVGAATGDGARARRGSASRACCARPSQPSASARGSSSDAVCPTAKGITYWPLVEIVKQSPGKSRGRLSPSCSRTRAASSPPSSSPLLSAPGSGPGRPTRRTGRSARCSRRSPATARSSSSSKICTGPSRRSSTSSSTSPASAPRAPILLLASARPELLETRPTWANAGRTAELLLLEPLAEPEVDALVDALLEAAHVPGRTARPRA